MRLYPAGGIATFRLATHGKAVTLGGGKLVVPPNVLLHMPIAAIQRSAANWERPEEFLPERWEKVRRRAGEKTSRLLGLPERWEQVRRRAGKAV